MDSGQSLLQVGPRATGSQPFGTPNRGLPSDENASKSNNPLPAVTVPKGGGAIRGLDEKYAVKPTSGTVTMSIPIPITPGRSGFQPVLNLAYSSGSGNSPFGMGWSLEIPRITRKTDKGIPKYDDSPNAVDCDVYLMGGEDLVPTFARDKHGSIEMDEVGRPVLVQEQRADYVIVPFSPRVEASFTRIERWTRVSDPGQVHWRTITGDNVTSIFGRDDKSRISDPSAPDRIFSWLISETYSVEGNAAIFEYKREDSSSVPLDRAHEAGRTAVTRSANCYLKSVRYGNRVPNRDKATWTPFSAFALEQSTWMFSLVLDYGEHDSQNPTTKEIRPWSYRQDAFSSYKSGFEIRTYRLCRRFLMFHHFRELGQGCLTKSTDLQYEENSFATYLTTATLVGYALDSKENQYNRQSLPPLEFSYSRFPTDGALADLTVHEIDAESLENIPHGVGGSSYQFLDLDGEGLPGIFVEQADGWYYKRNSTVPVSSGDGPTIPRFDPLRSVDPRPSATLTSGRARFTDLAGDGHLDVVATESGVWSYSERTEDEGWSVFVNMRSVPNIDLRNPNLRLLDVTGDGLADIVIDDEAVFTIYPSIGEEGYEGPISVAKALDEDHGPRIVFADVAESIYLADVSGDGLVDILRIRNGDVCYWPNMGYGRFGSRVVMENAPRFDSDEQFSQRNLHIADIDGSGPSDLIYIGRRGIEMYLNQAGNAFASPKIVPAFPPVDGLCQVDTIDLMGNGTACVVWSSPLPSYAGRSMRYVDITQGVKPHLLIKSANNFGSETYFHYAPSTKFYQLDRLAGKPWITRLSFPVHCVERVEVVDHVSKNRFEQRYAYHHGYFDGREREFGGFAMVEQWDTEVFERMVDSDALNVNAAWHVPPTYTKSWFHTGAFIEKDKISRQLAQEYFGAPLPADSAQFEQFLGTLLDDTVLASESLSTVAMEEACRGLRGKVLRTEIYAQDATSKSSIPYKVSEKNYTIVALQEQPDSHGSLVVRVDSREALSYDFERNLQDPRIAHQMTLQVDEYGNILRAVKIAYGRAKGMAYGIGKTAQEASLVMYDETDVTNAVLDAENHQLPKVSEVRSYQIYGLERARYKLEDFRQGDRQPIDGFPSISFDKWNGTGGQGKRLLSKKRTIYRSDDLSKLLEQGGLESTARPGESYTLAITPEILTTTFHRGSTDLSPSPEDMLRGGYVDLDKDGKWWIPSGRTYFAPGSVADELDEARTHFYLARRYRNPFGQDSVSYYDHYDLLVSRSVDALDNENRAENDYRLLRPFLVIDENGNRKRCTFDLLGYVIGVAVMGKAGENLGDSLETFQTNISEDQLNSLLESPRGAAAANLLGSATSRIIYCSDNYYCNRKPVFNISISRETHVSDNEPLKTQVAFTYLDGLGREVQKKAQAEAGDVRGQPVNVQWITSGWKIYNNKGSPVREYEPFFDDTHAFKYDERFGVSTTNIYDPLARVVAKILPNHSWTKSVYHPWELKLFDGNDTVLMNPADDPDVGAFVSRLPQDDYLPTWYQSRIRGQMGPENRKAAEKTRDHADTPAIMQSDPLGRVIVSIADNGRFGTLASFTALDIQGNARELTDPLGRIIERNLYSMTGICLCKESMDAGTNWKLQDVANNTILAWDSRAHAFKTVYDALRRPLEVWMSNSGQPMTKIGSYVYGESEQDQTSAIQYNKRGRLVEVRDQAGLLVHDRYDFKGNGVKRRRFFAQEYKAVLDWSIPVPLGESHHTFEQKFDAMNRLMEDKTPDGSCTAYTYNEGGLLEQTRLNLRGGESDTDSQNWPAYLMAAEYNAKRQRTRVTLGSGVVTSYQYDEFTFRTTDIVSKQGSDRLQSLHYTYDPIGNIVNTRDDSQQTIYFRNQVVEPSAEYTYDATYQLIEATGREHVGQAGRQPFDAFDRHNMTTEHPSNGNAMARYTEAYSYDAAGNLLACRHRGTDNSQPGWTRKFAYEEDSRLEPGRKSNRLSHCMVGQARESFEYDGHGNMTKMPHLEVLEWDHRDQLKAVAQQRGGGNVTHYVYDHEGNRVRKVTEQDGGRVRERLYLGLLEIGRKYTGSGELVLERETLHVFDDRNRIAVIDTRTVGDEPNVPSKVVRYQLHDLLGSAVVELDSGGLVISYEEYSPFGSTTYQSVRPGRTKRYRYIGKERDKESGLYCNGARYFAPWLCRWTSPDPVGASEDGNLFRYAGNRPLTFKDPSGLASKGNQEYIDVFMEIWKESKKRANIDKPITAASTKVEKAAHGISGHKHSIDVAKDLNENASGAMAKYKGRIYAGVVVNKETMTVTKIFATGHSSNGSNLDAVIMPEGMTLKVGQKLDFGGADATADFKFSGPDRIQNNHVKFAKDGHGYTVNEGGGWQKSPKPPKNGGGSGGGGEGGSPPPDAHTAPVETPPSASKGADALHQTSAPDALHSFHPKASTAEIAGESALKAAGKSTAKTVGSKVLKALPLIGDIVGGAMSVDSIADAAPENRARVAAEEAGGYLGGEIGGVVGGMLLVGAAVAVGVSPVGWVAAGVGVVGAIAGGVGGDMAGRAVVDWF